MRIAFIARNDGSDVRQTKICNSLCALGHDVYYIGWDKAPDKKKVLELDTRIKLAIYKRAYEFGSLNPSGWLHFLWFVAMELFRLKPEVVHVRDEPIAALILPYKKVLFKSIVLDIFDSLAARRYSSPVTYAMTWAIRNWAHLGSDRIIETSEHLRLMLGRFANKAIVILNVPDDTGDEIARDFPTSEALQICVGGGLSRKRERLDILLAAVELLPAGFVEVQASGMLTDGYSRDVFIKHPFVNYRWFDTPGEFRRHAASCDALLYLRGDSEETNYRSWVLPNRVFDAMSVGRPIIISRRLGISSWVEEQELGFACSPDDPRELARLFQRIREFREHLPKFAWKTRRLFVNHYKWQVMEQRLQYLYDGLMR